MSYDIHFSVDGCEVEPRAWLNITYNYAEFFVEVFGENGIRSLYGLRADQAIPLLETAIRVLGTETTENYWTSTRGNAGAALNDLLTLARLCPPHAIIEGD